MDQLNATLHIDSICRQRFASDKANLIPAQKILVERDVYEFIADDDEIPDERPFAKMREQAVGAKLNGKLKDIATVTTKPDQAYQANQSEPDFSK
jgi:hypothetical protein